jgi:DNA-binding CsgD family transcriptional regulator
LPVNSLRNPRAALLARVFFANVALIVGGVTFLGAALAVTVSWPLAGVEAGELAAWVLVILLIDYLVLRTVIPGRRIARQTAKEQGVELTRRELEIIRLITDSYTAKEIAEILFISPKTVDTHRGNILKKLELKDRVALTRYAIRRGFIKP